MKQESFDNGVRVAVGVGGGGVKDNTETEWPLNYGKESQKRVLIPIHQFQNFSFYRVNVMKKISLRHQLRGLSETGLKGLLDEVHLLCVSNY